MTTLRTLDQVTFANLNRALIGFDQLFNAKLASQNNYPPHNIVKLDDEHYVIEIAVSGFSKEEISVDINQAQLTITGEKADKTVYEYLHRGLAYRDFEQTFSLAEYMEVKSAEIIDGLLRINIVKIIPETQKTRRILIK